MTLSNAASSASASSSASPARPSAATLTRPTTSPSCRGPSLYLATIASSAAACAACSGKPGEETCDRLVAHDREATGFRAGATVRRAGGRAPARDPVGGAVAVPFPLSSGLPGCRQTDLDHASQGKGADCHDYPRYHARPAADVPERPAGPAPDHRRAGPGP